MIGMNPPPPMIGMTPPPPMIGMNHPPMIGMNSANQSMNHSPSLQIQVDFSVPPPGYIPQNSASSQPSG
uniref:Uncharacterized protein n=1 Tax=Panagrolaimus superbus TaxID=310955 RepID=A0A914YIR5_9BILA